MLTRAAVLDTYNGAPYEEQNDKAFNAKLGILFLSNVMASFL